MNVKRILLGAGVLGALVSPAEIIIKESVPLGSGGYTAGIKIDGSQVAGAYLSGSWTGGTGVWKWNATSLQYPACLPQMVASGGAFREQYASSPSSTGRAVGAALAKSVPGSGTLYISCLGQIGAKAASALMADQAFAVGLVKGFSGSMDDPQSQLAVNTGIYLGFGRVGSGSPAPIVKAGGTKLALASSLSTGTAYYFLARIAIGAGTDGKDVVSVLASPCSSYDGTLNWQQTFEVALDPAALTHLTAGGAYASNDDTAIFDEFIAATTLQEVSGIEPQVQCLIDGIGETTATSVSLNLVYSGYDASFEGATARLLYGTDPENLDQTFDLGTIPGETSFSATLDGLAVGGVYTIKTQTLLGGTLVYESQPVEVTLQGQPAFETFSVVPTLNTISCTAIPSYPEQDLTVEIAIGTDESNLSIAHTFENAAAGDELVFTTDPLEWGETYLVELRARYLLDDGTPVAMTPIRTSVTLTGTATYLPASGLWSNPANWDIGVLPAYGLIDALFSAPAALAEAQPQTLGARTLQVESQTTLDLAASTLEATRLLIGHTAQNATLTLKNATLTLDQGDTGSNGSTLPNGLTIGTQKNATLQLLDGALLNSGVCLMLSSGNGGRNLTVGPNATLHAKRIYTFNEADTFKIDGGTVSVDGAAVFGGGSGAGFKTSLTNAATLTVGGNLTIGHRKYATLRIEDRSTVTAANLYLSSTGDWGGNNTILISDSKLTSRGDILVPADTRHDHNTLTIRETGLSDTCVSCAGSCRIGYGTATAGGGSSNFNALNLQGGTLAVGDVLSCGGYYKQNSNNTVHISLPTSLLTAKNMWMTNNSTLKFTIPSGGFHQTPLQVSGNIRLYGDTRLVVDVTDYRGAYQPLALAGAMVGPEIEPSRLTVLPEEKAGLVTLVQSETGLAVRLATGTIITIR